VAFGYGSAKDIHSLELSKYNVFQEGWRNYPATNGVPAEGVGVWLHGLAQENVVHQRSASSGRKA
jgi:hypothetical protein